MNDCKTVELKFGTLRIYTGNGVELIAYETKDPITDQVVLMRKGDTVVSLDAPLFKDSVEELNEYVRSLGAKRIYTLIVDHLSPKDYLPEAEIVTADFSVNPLKNGGPKGLYNGFVNAFQGQIQSDVNEEYGVVKEGKIFLGDVNLEIIGKGEDFDVVIEEFNAVYTHMLGHDVHSIIGGEIGAKAMIAELNSFVEKGFGLILTAHYIPETIADVKTKISYIENIVSLAKSSSGKDEFAKKAKEVYPDYSGLNYLDITSNIFFN